MFAALSVPCEKTFAEISAKVEFQQCGEILRHGIFISLPLVFAHIFSVLVLYNAATCCKGSFGMVNNLLAYSVIVPMASAFSLPTCKTVVPVVRVPSCACAFGISAGHCLPLYRLSA